MSFNGRGKNVILKLTCGKVSIRRTLGGKRCHAIIIIEKGNALWEVWGLSIILIAAIWSIIPSMWFKIFKME